MRLYQSLLLAGFLFFSCGKTSSTYYPNVAVDTIISLQDPNYSKLNTAGNAVIISGGIAGICVYNNGGTFVAFDCCSPVNVDQHNPCTLDKTVSPPELVDVASGSRFSSADGGITKGPATRNLKQYNCSSISNIQIEITN